MEQHGGWPGRSPWIREAVAGLPRDLFAPDRLWHWDGNAYVPVDRAVDPSPWVELLYADPDAAAITQVIDGLATSSLSCQAVVVDMLDSLLLEPGHRVLELGTGTGWNAALLAERVGAERVTTVETDPTVAQTARVRLREHAPGVRGRVGDGSLGASDPIAPATAPYDRVIATYAVDRVPWAWVAQTRPGGRIVLPWGRLGHVALTVADDGRSASGWVQGLAQFMPDRNAAATASPDFVAVRGHGEPQHEGPWRRDLAPLRDDWDLRFTLRVALPDLHVTVAADDDGLNAWLYDDASWAVIAANGDGTATAHQGGTRRLADELDRAWEAWSALGCPSRYDFGLTVEEHRQYAWAKDPVTGPRWP
ncbi:methyltransferase domain-containing protein [Streptomyces sp. NPDC048057]|uniref:methyltransferase domain-containing protein n=1 Tax=Streptomyces sp. NPDC048057 TaxID=3155628 RepID=UPI0033CDCC0B